MSFPIKKAFLGVNTEVIEKLRQVGSCSPCIISELQVLPKIIQFISLPLGRPLFNVLCSGGCQIHACTSLESVQDLINPTIRTHAQDLLKSSKLLFMNLTSHVLIRNLLPRAALKKKKKERIALGLQTAVVLHLKFLQIWYSRSSCERQHIYGTCQHPIKMKIEPQVSNYIPLIRAIYKNNSEGISTQFIVPLIYNPLLGLDPPFIKLSL